MQTRHNHSDSHCPSHNRGRYHGESGCGCGYACSRGRGYSRSCHDHTQRRGPSNLAAVLWAFAAVGLFALIYVSGKLSGTNASALQIIWLRYAGGLVTMILMLVMQRNRGGSLTTTQPFLHACRAAAGGFGGVAAVYAAANMPVASASAIGLMDGFLTVLLGLIVLREHVSRPQWLATLISLAGAMIVVGAQGAFSTWDAELAGPAIIALAGALFVAIESIMIKTLAKTEAAFTILLYVNLFGFLILAWPGLTYWHAIPLQWMLAFCCLGPVAILAQYCNIKAFRLAKASIVGPIRYTWIIYGSVFGVLLFDEPVTVAMGIGVGLVLVGGGWLAALRSRH